MDVVAGVAPVAEEHILVVRVAATHLARYIIDAICFSLALRAVPVAFWDLVEGGGEAVCVVARVAPVAQEHSLVVLSPGPRQAPRKEVREAGSYSITGCTYVFVRLPPLHRYITPPSLRRVYTSQTL